MSQPNLMEDRLPNDPASLLKAAREGSPEAIQQLFEAYRAHLHLVARHSLDPNLKAKISASDIVQETLMEAHQCFAQFRGDNDAELLAWLRALLRNNVLNTARFFRQAQKRRVDLEVPLVGDFAPDKLGRPARALIDSTATPGVKAVSAEEADAIDRAIARLDEVHQRIIRLRIFDDLPFGRVAEELGRPEGATRALFYRAIDRLREELARDHVFSSRNFE